MPTGILITGVLVALTLIAPRRPRVLAGLSYRVAAAYNEAPFPFIYLIVISSIGPLADGRLDSPAGRWELGLAVLVVVGLLIIAWRGQRERPIVERALDEGLGVGWRAATQARWVDDVRTSPPLTRILFMPYVSRPAVVQRDRDVPYGQAGRHTCWTCITIGPDPQARRC